MKNLLSASKNATKKNKLTIIAAVAVISVVGAFALVSREQSSARFSTEAAKDEAQKVTVQSSDQPSEQVVLAASDKNDSPVTESQQTSVPAPVVATEVKQEGNAQPLEAQPAAPVVEPAQLSLSTDSCYVMATVPSAMTLSVDVHSDRKGGRSEYSLNSGKAYRFEVGGIAGMSVDAVLTNADGTVEKKVSGSMNSNCHVPEAPELPIALSISADGCYVSVTSPEQMTLTIDVSDGRKGGQSEHTIRPNKSYRLQAGTGLPGMMVIAVLTDATGEIRARATGVQPATCQL